MIAGPVLSLAAAVAMLSTAAAAPLSGPAHVIDGDTLYVSGQQVRLFGIDAPELQQTCAGAGGIVYGCGRRASAAMLDLTRGRVVSCEPRDTDRYGRIVATCATRAIDLGAEMVRMGWAIDVPRYSRGAYSEQERAAKAQRVGVWAGEFVDPAAWRRQAR